MKKSKYYMLLLFVAMNRIVDGHSLELMCDSANTKRYFILKASENRHIKKIIYKENKKKYRRQSSAYQITKQGLLYLCKNGEGTWLEKISAQDLKSIQFMRGGEYSPARKHNIVARATAATMALAAGADISIETFTHSYASGIGSLDDFESEWEGISFDAEDNIIECEPQESENILLWNDFMKMSMTQEEYLSLRLFQNVHSQTSPDYISFYDNNYIKEKVAEINTHLDQSAFKRGRYKGVIDSHFKTVLLFVAPMFGMTWTQWVSREELNALIQWQINFSIADPQLHRENGNAGAIIVNDPKQFHDLYLDLYGAMRSEHETFGGQFDHFYVISNDRNGANHLHKIMMDDDAEVVGLIMNGAVENGGYHENLKKSMADFELRDSVSGMETSIGILFDAKRLNRIIGRAKTFPEVPFKIICKPWQLPYYQGVVPDNVTVESPEWILN